MRAINRSPELFGRLIDQHFAEDAAGAGLAKALTWLPGVVAAQSANRFGAPGDADPERPDPGHDLGGDERRPQYGDPDRLPHGARRRAGALRFGRCGGGA
ncbi:MAG: hypothetical protein WDO24_19140 [Pseudomonadota bacterium]